jgi:predicted O-methyltransferase YrrM
MIVFASVVTEAAQAVTSPEFAGLLQQIKAADRDRLAVSEEVDGLSCDDRSSNAKHAPEIGGAFGYSAIWIGPRPAANWRLADVD